MAELATQLGYPCNENEVRTRLDEMQDPNHYAVYVAEVERGRLAGWIGAHIFRAVELNKCAEISGLVVDSKLRSRGIGKALLDAAEEWARTAGCDAISVSSNIKRRRAHKFYRRNGYTWNKRQESFRKRLTVA
jgi:GNAT superfamily N-acetyltransferase